MREGEGHDHLHRDVVVVDVAHIWVEPRVELDGERRAQPAVAERAAAPAERRDRVAAAQHEREAVGAGERAVLVPRRRESEQGADELSLCSLCVEEATRPLQERPREECHARSWTTIPTQPTYSSTPWTRPRTVLHSLAACPIWKVKIVSKPSTTRCVWKCHAAPRANWSAGVSCSFSKQYLQCSERRRGISTYRDGHDHLEGRAG